MKKTDIAMIILIASVSVLAAYFVAKAIPVLSATQEGTTAPSIQKIEVDSGGLKPDVKVFNSNAINPTVETLIGGESVAP